MLDATDGTPFEIYTDSERIILKKYAPGDIFTGECSGDLVLPPHPAPGVDVEDRVFLPEIRKFSRILALVANTIGEPYGTSNVSQKISFRSPVHYNKPHK
ncbi:MAG: hypothetical protein LUF92_01385 [Clostridiales bacterium]|nr:hypothetical protein [Clostridiales bacterium]